MSLFFYKKGDGSVGSCTVRVRQWDNKRKTRSVEMNRQTSFCLLSLF